MIEIIPKLVGLELPYGSISDNSMVEPITVGNFKDNDMGQVTISYRSFKQINKIYRKLGMSSSMTMKILISKLLTKCKLTDTIYEMIEAKTVNPGVLTWIPHNKYLAKIKSVDGVDEFLNEYIVKMFDAGYKLIGATILNNGELLDDIPVKLGKTSYKSKIKDITWDFGQVITPVLHCGDNKIHINTRAFINNNIRKNDSIVYTKTIYGNKFYIECIKSTKTSTIVTLTVCPCCRHQIIVINDNFICANPACLQVKINKILKWAGVLKLKTICNNRSAVNCMVMYHDVHSIIQIIDEHLLLKEYMSEDEFNKFEKEISELQYTKFEKWELLYGLLSPFRTIEQCKKLNCDIEGLVKLANEKDDKLCKYILDTEQVLSKIIFRRYCK